MVRVVVDPPVALDDGVLVAADGGPVAADGAPPDHKLTHPNFQKDDCFDCRWYKFWPKWMPELAIKHLVHPDVVINSIEARWINGKLGAGCTHCASHAASSESGHTCSYSSFDVDSPKMCQIAAFKKHVKSEAHLRIVAKAFGIDPDLLVAQSRNLDPNVVLGVPIGLSFYWAIWNGQHKNTFRDFKSFTEAHDIRGEASVAWGFLRFLGTPRDSEDS